MKDSDITQASGIGYYINKVFIDLSKELNDAKHSILLGKAITLDKGILNNPSLLV